GVICYKIFKKIDNRYTHKQRIPILGLALCMFLAYCSERYFGVADITGAFIAGVILCNIRDAQYIERKLNINSYMLFGPIFFAGIGIKTNIQGISSSMLLFSVFFVLVALIAKIIGCGGISKMMRYSWKDSLKIGIGMMTRGEVALIVAQKGLDVGLLEPAYFAPVIILIITSSILTPILLKLLYKNEPAEV
ncbi:MAG: cation:proton antiporter, partial [Clostridia bacterium]|nr:cation:proton antiporter [Clostridia bacterium]